MSIRRKKIRSTVAAVKIYLDLAEREPERLDWYRSAAHFMSRLLALYGDRRGY